MFDVYGTLFDVHPVKAACDEQFPGKGDQISGSWRTKQTIVLSNGTDAMLAKLIQNAGFTDLFDELVSIDGIKQAKPSPAAYMHWFKNSGLKRDEVLFLSSNGWDIAGAKNFGFHTAWINRDDKPIDMPDLAPDAVYEDLSGILEWVTDEAAWP
ncbi:MULTISPECIES: HAD-IA family hydrolase [unclassified Exiguobacterium]|uniref:HAD-IA family hydrolase n=1 Tax=unclassified Exiguobacterium TaxID=2644629 RepID=UPI0027E15E36|nr:HAD-IA family hydrolase [Exiguobacterium sp. s55]